MWIANSYTTNVIRRFSGWRKTKPDKNRNARNNEEEQQKFVGKNKWIVYKTNDNIDLTHLNN